MEILAKEFDLMGVSPKELRIIGQSIFESFLYDVRKDKGMKENVKDHIMQSEGMPDGLFDDLSTEYEKFRIFMIFKDKCEFSNGETIRLLSEACNTK